MAPIRIGLVGAGSMGSLHARVISSSSRCSLAWIVDPRDDAGSALANRFSTTWLPELDALSGVDAVVVASATETHHDIARRVLAEGVPLLVEKPLADTLAHSEDIIAESDKRDVPVMCGLLERFNPAILTAVSFIEDPQHIIATRHSPYVARIRTGVASDLLVHDIDVILRMAGAFPEHVAGQLGYSHPESAPFAEDVADVSLRFASGLVATASASRLSQRKIRSLSVAELDRLVEIDLLRQDITIYRHMGTSASDDDTGLGYRQQTVIDIPVIREPREPLAAQLDRFADLVEGRVDAAAERSSILPPHVIVDQLRRAVVSETTETD
jgi:predicted dehydrogenase